jgi:hypothetical protein
MDKKIIFRIIVDIVIAFCAVFGLWYVFLPLGLIAAWFFPYYAELTVAGFVYDALFSMGRGFGLFGYAGLVVTIIALAVVSFLKFVIRR